MEVLSDDGAQILQVPQSGSYRLLNVAPSTYDYFALWVPWLQTDALLYSLLWPRHDNGKSCSLDVGTVYKFCFALFQLSLHC